MTRKYPGLTTGARAKGRSTGVSGLPSMLKEVEKLPACIGKPCTTATSRTSGIASIERITWRENTTLCLHSNLLFGREIVIVNKFCVSKPGSICQRRFALLTIRPVAIKSTSVIATSEATRMATSRCRLRPAVELRASSFMTSPGFADETRNAGMMPVINAVSEATINVNRRTVRSTVASCASGTSAGIKGRSRTRLPYARPTPIAPAGRTINADSARNCRRIRSLAAPRAARMATSFWRVVARARSRFATFPHATRSTRPVQANSNSNTRRDPPNT